MHRILQLINNPKVHTIIILVLSIIVTVLAIWHLRQLFKNRVRKFYSKINAPSLVGIYVVIILLIGFAAYAIYHVGIKYNNYLNTLKATGFAADDIAKLSIFDMQANTLAISTLVVTIASIVLTILSLYKDRKAEINSQKLEESREQIQQAEEAIKNLSNIVSLTFVHDNQRECYYDAVNELINLNSVNKSSFYNHFRIAQISLINNVIAKKEEDINLTSEYDRIIKIAEQIINSDTVSELDSQFAYLEALHALYRKIKNGVQKNMEGVQDDITKAFSYLKKVNRTLGDDTFGHISNLSALTHFWSGMYKIRHGELSEGERLFKTARLEIDEALEKNKDKIEFLNHKAVILQQTYDLTQEEALYEELIAIYMNIMNRKTRYFKAYLNFASALIRSVKKMAGMGMLDQYPDFRVIEAIESTDCDRMLRMLKYAKKTLMQSIEIAPRFINNYYKLGEAVTVQYAIQKYGKFEVEDENKLINEAQDAFLKAKKISTESIPCKLCECAFYKTIGDTTQANLLEAEVMELLGKQ